MSDWAGIGEFPMTWRSGDLTITAPMAPVVTDYGFRVYGVFARRGRKVLPVDPDLGFHSPPVLVKDPTGDVVVRGPNGKKVRLRRDPLAAFTTIVTDAVRLFDGH